MQGFGGQQCNYPKKSLCSLYGFIAIYSNSGNSLYVVNTTEHYLSKFGLMKFSISMRLRRSLRYAVVYARLCFNLLPVSTSTGCH